MLFSLKAPPETVALRALGALLEAFEARLAGEGGRLAEAVEAAGLRRMNSELAHCAGQTVLLVKTASRELEEFGVAPDAAIREMAAVLARAGRALKDAGREAEARKAAAAEARRILADMRPRYEAAVENLMNYQDAVEMLKRREICRHLLRIGEAVVRATRVS